MEEENKTRETRTLANGTVVDAKTGKFLTQPTEGNITRDNAREYHRMRREVKQRALEEAIIAGTQSIDLRHGLQSLGLAMVNIILQTDRLKRDDKAAVLAFKALMSASDLATDAKNNTDSETKTAENVTIGDVNRALEALDKLRSEIDRLSKTVDADSRDVS